MHGHGEDLRYLLIGLASVWTSRRPHLQPFRAPTHGRAAPNVTSIQKEAEGAADAQLTPRGGDTEARQQKARRDTIPDLFLKHLDETFATCI